MSRWKGLFLISVAALVAVLAILVTVPRVAHGAASEPVLITNPEVTPVLTQEVSQLPAQAIGLICSEANCEQLPYNPTSVFGSSDYSVPPKKVFVVTEVEIHDGSGVGVNLTCSSDTSLTYGLWQVATTGTAQYLIPNGIPLPGSCYPKVALSKTASGIQVFLRGYVSGPNGTD